jgi:hypothetical protein
VRYGAGTTFVTKTFTGSVSCSNAQFGDPIFGVIKSCSYSSTTIATSGSSDGGWTTCAKEGGVCSVSGTHQVRYGISDHYVTKSVTGSIACTNKAFGSDPAYLHVKSCSYQ